jgi:TetR/AcrR family transcriptional repressor of nem operon
MPELDHPTRALLLDAALGLADDNSLGELSIDEIVRAAGVAKGTFYVHFHDRSEFAVALHDRFHDRLRERIAKAIIGMAPGAKRLRRGGTAYLEGCLDAVGVKAMLAHARGEPAISRKVTESNDRFARQCADDVRAMGRRHPLETARLFVAAAAETALLEMEGGRQPKLRTALWELLGT